MNLLLHTNHPKLSGLKQHYQIIWAHLLEPNDPGLCTAQVALTFCDWLLSTKLDGSNCWLVVGWAHSSSSPSRRAWAGSCGDWQGFNCDELQNLLMPRLRELLQCHFGPMLLATCVAEALGRLKTWKQHHPLMKKPQSHVPIRVAHRLEGAIFTNIQIFIQ